MRKIAVVCIGLCCLGLHSETNNVRSLFRDASRATSTTNLDRGIDTLLFLNHINYVVETLQTYQNALVLEQEYKTINPNNLNMNLIPNETIKDQVVKLLDAIYAMRNIQKDYDREKSKLERARINARRDMWMKFAQNAVSSGMASAQGSTPWEIGLGAGAAILGEAVSAYAEFEKAKREIQERGESNAFAYADQKESQMHEAYKSLVNLQYKFGAAKDRTNGGPSEMDDEFTIPDKFRLSGENAKNLVKALKCDDFNNVYKELKDYKRLDAYTFFPTFWYYYAVIAYKTGHLIDALAACRHFEAINRGLFRSDPMAAAVAMTEICVSVERKSIDANRIRALLEVIMKNDRECKNSDWEYFCASIYNQVLNDQPMACEILDAMIARLERQNKEKLVKYSDLFREKEKELAKEDEDECQKLRENFFKEHSVPEDSDLARAQILYRDILARNQDPLTMEYLRSVCIRNTTASLEKLYYVGSMKSEALWNIAKKDIERLNLRYEKYGKKTGEFVFEIPLTWFVLGDMTISMDLYQGSNKVDTVVETLGKRSITKGLKEYDVVSIRIPCCPNMLNGKDSFAVRLPHKSWPVQILYMPNICYDIDQSLANGREARYVPNTAEFSGEVRQLTIEDMDKVKDTILKWPLEQDWKRYFFAYANKIPVRQDGIKEIEVKDRSYVVHYENPDKLHRTLQLKILAFNRYGAKFCTLQSEVELAPEAKGELMVCWPDELKGCAQPAYCALEVKNCRTMANRFTDKANWVVGKWNAWWSDGDERKESETKEKEQK